MFDSFNERAKELFIDATRELATSFIDAEHEYRISHGIDVQVPINTPEDVCSLPSIVTEHNSTIKSLT